MPVDTIIARKLVKAIGDEFWKKNGSPGQQQVGSGKNEWLNASLGRKDVVVITEFMRNGEMDNLLIETAKLIEPKINQIEHGTETTWIFSVKELGKGYDFDINIVRFQTELDYCITFLIRDINFDIRLKTFVFFLYFMAVLEAKDIQFTVW